MRLGISKKRWLLLILLVLTIPLLVGLGWSSLVLAVLWIGYWSLQATSRRATHFWQKFLVGMMSILGVFILAITTRIFLFEICVVPTGSMRNTIAVGDHLLIDKLNYGPRLPRSIIDVPWAHALYLVFAGSQKYTDLYESTKVRRYQRLSGLGHIQRNDVVVFESPHDRSTLLVKRCIALAGDTVTIRNGQVWINGVEQALPTRALMDYTIYYEENSSIEDSLTKRHLVRKGKDNQATIRTSADEMNQLQALPGFDSSRIYTYPSNQPARLWPPDTSLQWSIDDYGPLVIPKQGDQVRSSLYIGGLPYFPSSADLQLDSTLSLIPENYYFVMGDNRHGSSDSRKWGLVPEHCIKGKATYVLFSRNTDYLFGRVLRKLR